MSSKRQRLLDESTVLAVSSSTSRAAMASVTIFPVDTSAKELLAYYRENQILHVRGCLGATAESRTALSGVMDAIRSLYSGDPAVVEKTFTLESRGEEELSAASLFGLTSCPAGIYYSSFIAQGQKSTAVGGFKAALPLLELPFASGVMNCTKPIWMFVGKNDGKTSLRGRNEHVDAVTHDGTWHVQSSGCKVWYVRPADIDEWGAERGGALQIDGSGDLLEEDGTEVSENVPRLRVECRTGDVLVINTRMWWHQTRIPPTASGDRLSISYARDFFAPSLRPQCGDDKESGTDEGASSGLQRSQEEKDEDEDEVYTNLEGLYASKDVAAGDVVLTEEEMPNCSLPRAESPTCEVVWLESGEGALVARVDLRIGDWLTIAPSDSENESDDSDDSSGGSDFDCGSESDNGDD
mmetsp:Transcript_29167/g.49236  ORF Transcript_29167/g.49236 Transcript_29167/m.49236 type:complete len:410 (+) Transcript_29167:60-1289(+)